ncbi:MAG: hypothetical protein WBV94_01330 [Blastocatellia bacterium]
MRVRINFVSAFVVIFALTYTLNARQACQQHSPDAHAQHHSGVNSRGDHAMGFSHEKTTHHFRLTADGGAIDVSANDAKDSESRDQIRMHLSHIAGLFKEGDFSKPMFTHGKNPPGVPVMSRMKAEIDYKYQEIERGGRVMITTANAEALAAIHDFLRFQITDHETGDSLEITQDK